MEQQFCIPEVLLSSPDRVSLGRRLLWKPQNAADVADNVQQAGPRSDSGERGSPHSADLGCFPSALPSLAHARARTRIDPGSAVTFFI